MLNNKKCYEMIFLNKNQNKNEYILMVSQNGKGCCKMYVQDE